MSEAERAYGAALEEIERVKAAAGTELRLDGEDFHALERLPEAVREIEGLELLDLDNTSVTDLTPLAGLTGVQALWLNNTSVTDLTPLAGFARLQELTLTNTNVTDLTPLAGFARLQELWLDNTSVTDLTSLAGLDGLRQLWLDNTNVTNLTPLAGLAGVQRLSLTNTSVSDLTPLAGLTGLQELTLTNTSITDLTPLAGLTGLQRLWLDNTSVTDLRPIAGLAQLAEGDDRFDGLRFADTPAARATPDLTRLAAIEDGPDCARQTLAYLQTLPPWPEPLPWEADEKPASASDPTDTPARPAPGAAPLRVHFKDGRLTEAPLAHGMEGETEARAAQGWLALKEYLEDLQDRRARIGNTMPQLSRVLDRLARALDAPTPDVENAIRFGMQAERFIRLSATAPGVLSNDEDVADIENFALELGRYVAREPVWNAYKSDALPAPDAMEQVALAIPDLRDFERMLSGTDWIDPTVAVAYGEIVSQAENEPREPVSGKGALDATREVVNEIAEEAVEEVKQAKAKGLWSEVKTETRKQVIKGVVAAGLTTTGASAGIAADLLLNNAGVLTALAARFPETFGYVIQALQYLGWVTL